MPWPLGTRERGGVAFSGAQSEKHGEKRQLVRFLSLLIPCHVLYVVSFLGLGSFTVFSSFLCLKTSLQPLQSQAIWCGVSGVRHSLWEQAAELECWGSYQYALGNSVSVQRLSFPVLQLVTAAPF